MVGFDGDDVIKTKVIPCAEKSYLTYEIEDSIRVEEFYNYYKGISFDIDIDGEGYIICF